MFAKLYLSFYCTTPKLSAKYDQVRTCVAGWIVHQTLSNRARRLLHEPPRVPRDRPRTSLRPWRKLRGSHWNAGTEFTIGYWIFLEMFHTFIVPDTGWTEYYRKPVLHLLKRTWNMRLVRCSTDLRYYMKRSEPKQKLFLQVKLLIINILSILFNSIVSTNVSVYWI